MATAFGVIREKIDEDVKALQESLSDDRAKDFEHYKYLTGQIRGLKSAKLHIDTLEQQYTEED